MPGCRQNAVSPERDFFISRMACKSNALVDQSCPQAEATSLRIDQQQAQSCDAGLIVFHQHDAADILAVQLRDPAAFELRIEIVDEIGDDLRAQALERLGPTILLQIELRVARDDPAEVARTRFAQNVTRLCARLRLQLI